MLIYKNSYLVPFTSIIKANYSKKKKKKKKSKLDYYVTKGSWATLPNLPGPRYSSFIKKITSTNISQFYSKAFRTDL